MHWIFYQSPTHNGRFIPFNSIFIINNWLKELYTERVIVNHFHDLIIIMEETTIFFNP